MSAIFQTRLSAHLVDAFIITFEKYQFQCFIRDMENQQTMCDEVKDALELGTSNKSVRLYKSPLHT